MSRRVKVSGIEWIESIPEDWEVDRLKSRFSFGKGLPITKENLRESGVSVISYGQIHSKHNVGTRVKQELVRYVDESYLVTNASSLVTKGDFVFADTSEDVNGCGNCVYVDDDITLFAGYHTIILKSKSDVNNKYLAYLFQTDCWRSQIRSSVLGVKLFSVTKKLLNNTTILCPPEKEQERIVKELDVICDNIDELITTNQNSIKDYKKYKQSIITEAITKGLNNTALKKTGNIHIPEIPEQWQMKRLKYVFEIKKDIAGKEGYDILSITQKGIKVKDISSNEGQLAADYSKYQLVDVGDFAMNHMDLLTGWVDVSKYAGVTSPDYRVFRFINEDGYCKEYYLYLMQMCYMNRIFYGLGQGVSNLGRWRLQADKFLNFSIPIPPFEEQKAIATYLDNKCAEIENLIAAKEKTIKELESYKKSMIYEYVTGKKEVI